MRRLLPKVDYRASTQHLEGLIHSSPGDNVEAFGRIREGVVALPLSSLLHLCSARHVQAWLVSHNEVAASATHASPGVQRFIHHTSPHLPCTGRANHPSKCATARHRQTNTRNGPHADPELLHRLPLMSWIHFFSCLGLMYESVRHRWTVW